MARAIERALRRVRRRRRGLREPPAAGRLTVLPSDVFLVSYYHYLVKMRNIPPGYDLARFADSFLAGGLDEFGRWGDHVTGWLDAREGGEDFVLLRYEDLMQAPRDALVAALGLIGSDASA